MMFFYKLFKIIHRRTDFEIMSRAMIEQMEEIYYPSRIKMRRQRQEYVKTIVATCEIAKSMLNNIKKTIQ